MNKEDPTSNKDFYITQTMRDNPFAAFVDGKGKREKYVGEKYASEQPQKQEVRQ